MERGNAGLPAWLARWQAQWRPQWQGQRQERRPCRWPRALANALLPCCCALCGATVDSTVCAPCRVRYVDDPGHRPRCRRCANPVAALDADVLCGACQAGAPAYDSTVAAADYGTPLDSLVLQLKFGGALALAPWFAQLIGCAAEAQALAQAEVQGQALAQAQAHGQAQELAQAQRQAHALAQAQAEAQPQGSARPDLLCPVPLGPQRLAERGFNQALEIARPLARIMGVPLHARLAIRARDTRAQSSVAPGERRHNIRHAFTLAPEASALVCGRHVGIVDDVMTSGATLNELAGTFKRFGAARVSCFVFARTPPR